MTVRRRLLLVSVAFSIPVLILVVQSLGVGATGPSAAAREMEGTAYARPLIGLLDRLSSHRVATVREKLGLGVFTSVTEASLRVDEAVDELRKMQAALGARLDVTPDGLRGRHREHASVETIASEWVVLKRDLPGLSADAAGERHAHLAADVRALNRHVGDTSHLILDPDLDSYYTMDLVVVVLPQVIDRLAAVGELASLHVGAPLSPGDRITLAVLAQVLQENDRDRVLTDADTALSEDANFHGVSPTLMRIQAPTAAFVTAVDRVISHLRVAGGESDGRAELMRAGESAVEARQAAFALWTASENELDRLLNARMRALRLALWGPLAVALVVWMGAVAATWLLGQTEPEMSIGEGRMPVHAVGHEARVVVGEARVPKARPPWSPPPLASKSGSASVSVSPPASPPDASPGEFVERRRPGRPFTGATPPKRA